MFGVRVLVVFLLRPINKNPQENRKLRPGEVIEEKKVKANLVKVLSECYTLYCRGNYVCNKTIEMIRSSSNTLCI